MTNAAPINHDELTTSSVPLLEQRQSITESLAQPFDMNKTNSGITFSSDNIFQQEITQPLPAHNIKSLVKKLDYEYGDNELFQDSLTALYETKQLWNELDTIANNFAYDVSFTLKLDEFIEQDLTQSTQTSNTYLLPKSHLSPVIQYHETNDISAYQIQQTYASSSTNDFGEFGDDFFISLFRVSTLYYLVALYLLILFLQWLIRFILRLFP